MGAISVRELNSSLSSTISRVEAGETIKILKNGKVVAEMTPPRERSPEWRALYDETVAMMRRGLPLGVGKITEDDKYGDAEL